MAKEYIRVVNGREYKQRISTKTISVSVPFYEMVQEYAKKNKMSMAKLTREALLKYMEENNE